MNNGRALASTSLPALLGAAVLIAATASGCNAPPAAPPLSPSPRPPAVAAGPGPSAHSSLDVDGDGTVTSQTDALLILRYVSGFRGDVLIAGAVGPQCKRCTAEQIEAYLGSL